MKNSTRAAKAKQAGRPRMGRPSSKEAHAVNVAETKRLIVAIKAGAGNLTNIEIEKGLGIGKDLDTGVFSGQGRYIGRYLKGTGLTPDRLSQIAEKARELGWLPQDIKLGGLVRHHPFTHLGVPEGALLSERIQDIKKERVLLLKAQKDAVGALRRLVSTMNSCKTVGFSYLVPDEIDGVSFDVVFEGINLDLENAIEKIDSCILLNDEPTGP